MNTSLYQEKLQKMRDVAESHLVQPSVVEPILQTVEELFYELQVHQIELEMQNEELLRLQRDLDRERARYFDLYEFAPVGYFTLTKEGLILQTNLVASNMLGVTRNEMINQPIIRFVSSEYQDIYYLHLKQLIKTGGSQSCDLKMMKNDGSQFWGHLAANADLDDERNCIFRIVMSDITAQKVAEKVLQEALQHLENTVATTEEEMGSIKKEMSEVESALNVLVKRKGVDMTATQSALTEGVAATVQPFIEKLKRENIRQNQANFIAALEINLKHLVGIYGSTNSSTIGSTSGLTPTEIQVASLIRNGLSTKEIAITLNISADTVSTHRKHIRKKLGLDGKQVNLFSHLLAAI